MVELTIFDVLEVLLCFVFGDGGCDEFGESFEWSWFFL